MGGLWRFFRGLRMDNGILEPVSEIGGLAAFVARLRWLPLALGVAGWAHQANMEVVVMAPPRPDLGKPAAVALGVAAQRLLDRGVDEDTLHARLLRGVAQNHQMARRENLRIDVEPVGAHHHDGGHLLALLARQQMFRHRRQPDIGIEPDLMAGVAAKRRTAARLPDVADQYSRPAGILVRLD